MKKILIVITTAFVEFGGLTTVALNYYRFMDKTGMQIDFASTNEPDLSLTEELKKWGSRYYNLGRRSKIFFYRKNLQALIEKNRYDVIHIHSNSATATLELQIAKKANVCQRIVHIHNSTCSHMKLHRLLKPFFDKYYTYPVACSYKAGEWIFPKGKFTILNNAIDTKRFEFAEIARNRIRNQYHLEHCFVLVHVGKINEQKNHTFLVDVFVKVLQSCPSARLLCVGDGPLRENILEQAKGCGVEDKIIITGMQKNVNDYLAAGDCFVFPSLWEGLPLSLVEAQASGLRCIVSNRITTEANVTGKVQYLSLELPVSEWAEQILSVVEYDRAAECEDNIRLIAENGFSIQKNADRLRKIYLSEGKSFHV